MSGKNQNDKEQGILQRFTPKNSRSLTPTEKAISGGFSGLFSRLVIAPLDVIKIYMQLHPRAKSSLHSSHNSSGILATFRNIYSVDGFKGFYKGNLSASVLYISYSSTQFYVFSLTEQLFKKIKIRKEAKSMMCGSLAGLTATIVTYPFDLLRTRFAAQLLSDKVYSSYYLAVKMIYCQEGLFGFYKGLGSASLQIIPYIGIIFGSYDIISSLILKINKKYNIAQTGTTNLINNAITGAAAGLVGKFSIYPLDLVRKRMQVQCPSLNKFVGKNIPNCPKGLLSTFKYIVINEGVVGLFRGLWPSLLKAGPSSASSFFAFGVAQNLFIKYS